MRPTGHDPRPPLCVPTDELIRDIFIAEVGRLPAARRRYRVEPDYDEDNADWYALEDLGDVLEARAYAEPEWPDVDEVPEDAWNHRVLDDACDTLVPDEPADASPAFTVSITFSDQNAQRGYEFEQWVVNRFDPTVLSLLEWSSDKGVNGWTPISSMHPDLVFRDKTSMCRHPRRFAVECKWREKNWRGGIEWARPEQIVRYQTFSERYKMPVFVVIGIGGSPLRPEEVYLVPLEKLAVPFVSLAYLSRFRRRVADEMFRWDSAEQRIS